MTKNKLDMRDDISVDEYVVSLVDTEITKDTKVLIRLMGKISGKQPQLWGIGTIGFDIYHYKYDSGHEGDAHVVSFYPRKGKITIYLMDGTSRYTKLLERLGKHKSTRVCIHLRRLSDVDISILEQIIQESYDYVKSQDGQMHRALG